VFSKQPQLLSWRFSSVQIKIIGLIAGVLCTLLTGAGFLHIIAYKYAPDATPIRSLTFFDCFFFVFLLATTISYDSAIVPDAPFPRITIIAIILTGVAFVPYSIGQIVAAARMRSPYDSRLAYDPTSHHVVVVGGGALREAFTLRHFLDEFFARSHGPQVAATRVVILAAHDPSPMCTRVLREPIFRHRVQWVKGSALALDSLLDKASLLTARACFVLARKFASDSRASDAENILRAMAVASAAGYGRVPIYVQCLLPDNKLQFSHFADIVVCVDEFKLAILARSALCPGFSTLIYLLTTTIAMKSTNEGISNSQGVTNLSPCAATPLNSEEGASRQLWGDWDDFSHSARQGIYTVTDVSALRDRLFLEVAQSAYVEMGLILFAITASVDIAGSKILFSPLEHRFNGNETLFVICSTLTEAEGIRKCPKQRVPSENYTHNVASKNDPGIPSHLTPLKLPSPSLSIPPSNDQAISDPGRSSLAVVDFPSFQLQTVASRRKRASIQGNRSPKLYGTRCRKVASSHLGLGLNRYHTVNVTGPRPRRKSWDPSIDSSEEEGGLPRVVRRVVRRPLAMWKKFQRPSNLPTSPELAPLLWGESGEHPTTTHSDTDAESLVLRSAEADRTTLMHPRMFPGILGALDENEHNILQVSPLFTSPASLEPEFQPQAPPITAQVKSISPEMAAPSRTLPPPSVVASTSEITGADDLDPSTLKNHVVLCAPAASGTFPSNLECFLGPLWTRSPSLTSAIPLPGEDPRVPVVLITQAVPPPMEWARLLLRFDAEAILHYVHGSPLVPGNLIRAGAHRASRAIVLADEDAVVGSTQAVSEKTEDAHAIMVCAQIILVLNSMIPTNN
jgi:hypothetical protein